MADAIVSRPVPVRKIKDGVVEGEQTGAPIEAGNMPRVGDYNDRGARVADVSMTANGLLLVNLK